MTLLRTTTRIIHLLVPFCCGMVLASDHEIQLIGIGRLSGTACDLSEMEGSLENGTPHNRLGGLSALEYTGDAGRFIALSDRGPDDGAIGYQCRFHLLDIQIQADPVSAGTWTVHVHPVATTMLCDRQKQAFSGSAAELQPRESCAGRLDPEGIRLNAAGGLFVSDEYGPQIIEFSQDGHEKRRLALPNHLLVRHAADSREAENTGNNFGRASNKGMEGLSISSDGKCLTGIMQNVLLQDGERQEDGTPRGINCRMVQLSLDSGQFTEYVYQLDQPEYGLNEIVAINDHEFLVIERDGKTGHDSRFKRIMKVNTARATNVVALNQLPTNALPDTITPVKKTTFLDLLAPRLALSNDDIPEKIEGLTFGARLPDGRRTLLICSDNDFEADEPSLIYVFAIPNDHSVAHNGSHSN